MRKRVAVALKFGESKFAAKQTFGPEVDINRIVERFKKTGELPKRVGQPMYGDFSRVPGYHQSQTMLIRANALFRTLPKDMQEALLANPRKFFSEHLGPAKPAPAPTPTSEASPGAPAPAPAPAFPPPTPTPQQPVVKTP